MSLAVVFLTLVLIAPPPGYERAVAQVPVRHWALVRAATIDRDSSGQARRRDMSIHLTPYRRDGQLHHEVGHIVMYADPDLEQTWCSRFRRHDRLVGIPPTKYARTSCAEDFAESYEEILEHGCLEDPDRDRIMKTRVFRRGELPPCDA